MIYLFEDRKDRMSLYLNENLGAYKDVLNTDRIIDVKLMELDLYIKTLKNLEVLVLHKSYSFIDQSIKPQNIKDIVRSLDKKFVLFSGGLKTAVVDDYEITINSGDFYNNLPKFLKYNQEEKDFNLHYLAFENEREVDLHQLKKFQNEAFKAILNFNTEQVHVGKLYKRIKNLSEEFLVSESFEAYKEKLNSLLMREKPVETQTVFNQLQKMIASYEIN
ncbi:MAG: hypothetical protein LAT51_12495 [Flavobacteriaceae bacterium]|nr:hypothetical protein [Flavobacteriaceae bacterium]